MTWFLTICEAERVTDCWDAGKGREVGGTQKGGGDITYAKSSEINRHHHQRNQPRDRRDHTPHEPANHARERDERRDERERARDGVQHERTRQRIGTIDAGAAVGRAVDLLHDAHGAVADGFREAEVLVGLVWWHVEDAVAERTEGHGGVADVGLVGEEDFEDPDVADDRGGDAGDEEEDGGDEEAGDADEVNDAGHGGGCGVVVVGWWCWWV